MDGTKKPNYRDFPVSNETKNLKIWKNLDIEQNGKLNILDNEKIYESRIYPMKEENDEVKILSKINTKTNKITYIIFSKNITSKNEIIDKNEYQSLIQDLEHDLRNVLDVENKQVLSGNQIMHEIL